MTRCVNMTEIQVQSQRDVSSEVDEEENLSVHSHDGENSSRNTTKTTSTKKRRSKVDILEERFESRFSSMENKMDSILASLSQRQEPMSSGNGKSPIEDSPPTPAQHQGNGKSPNFEMDDEDTVSLHPSGNENFVKYDSENCSDDENLNPVTKKCLLEIFGEDACIKKSETKSGINIETSQREVLEQSYRSSSPNNVTAYAEENKDLFPVDEQTEKFLQVPTLDDLIESCLVRKYGAKANFNKHGKYLFSQPCKMVEKTAYRGQQAAYMGIVMQLYIQQGLGALINMLPEDTNIVQKVKDIFAMCTRSLDQLGRTGAFFHIIRRQVAMSDTSLFELDDARTMSNLPLTSDGVFGADLEKTLKQKKEKRKTLDDLLPEKFNRKEPLKRKSSDNSGQLVVKKPYTASYTSSAQSTSYGKNQSTFRIPKLSQTQSTFRNKSKYDKSDSRTDNRTKSFQSSTGNKTRTSGIRSTKQ
ncbi:uncharacterized protein LOC123553913 [Mercenaria mercenaria]|uniref:uncharacterized protein LOC123553913 n=1 Tax=Mercenaria mercenaria TaxID=6596 RepID=UPI00234E9C93|nr:uncharacterized protein LOC123553913 [Mercenaria mercenaria]